MESQLSVPLNPNIADVREYVRIKLKNLDIELTDFEMEVLVMTANIDEDTESQWTPVQYERAGKSMLVKVIPELLLRSDVVEGGYSIKHNRDGIQMYYNLLCSDLGIANALTTKATLANKSYLW